MIKFKLTDNETKKFNDIVLLHEKSKKRRESGIHYDALEPIEKVEINIEFEKLTIFSHELHRLLSLRGNEPIHSKNMYRNRRVPVTDPEFYNHPHSIKDLILIIKASTQEPSSCPTRKKLFI